MRVYTTYNAMTKFEAWFELFVDAFFSILVAVVGYGVFLGLTFQINVYATGNYERGFLGGATFIVPLVGGLISLYPAWKFFKWWRRVGRPPMSD